MSNPSVAKFKTKMLELREQMRYNTHERLIAMGEEIAENMANAAPKDVGTLAASVRVLDISKVTYGSARLAIKIKAGGPTTLRRSAKSGNVYDYAHAIEFGNREHTAQPFFYPTYRRYRSAWPDKFQETVEETLQKGRVLIQHRVNNAARRGGAGVESRGAGRKPR